MKEKKKETAASASHTSRIRQHTKDIVLIAMFTALMAICAQITIPMPPPFVPFTLQTLAVFLAGSFLGMKRSIISITAYLLLGLVGVPVFAQFKGGLGALLGPTGGFIIGFVATAAIVGFFHDKWGDKIWVMVVAMALGLLACYLFGTVWFVILYNQSKGGMDLWKALSICVIPFLLFDAVKIIVASILSSRVHKIAKL